MFAVSCLLAAFGAAFLFLGLTDWRSHDLERAIERRIRTRMRRTFGEEAARLMEGRLRQGMRARMDAVGITLPQVGTYSVAGGALAFVVGLLLAAMMGLGAGVPALAIVLGVVGFFGLAPYTINARYARWQRDVVADMPDLILWFDMYLALGYSVSAALERAVRRLVPDRPLAREIARLFRDIAKDSDFGQALSAVELRMGHQELTQFWEGIRAGWVSATPKDTLKGIAATIERLEDLAVAQKTSRAALLMPLLVGGMFMVIMGLLMLPAIQQFTSNVGLLGSGL